MVGRLYSVPSRLYGLHRNRVCLGVCMVSYAITGTIGHYRTLSDITRHYWTALDTVGRRWEIFGQGWTALDGLDTIGQHWTVLDGIGQPWGVLDSVGHYRTTVMPHSVYVLDAVFGISIHRVFPMHGGLSGIWCRGIHLNLKPTVARLNMANAA